MTAFPKWHSALQSHFPKHQHFKQKENTMSAAIINVLTANEKLRLESRMRRMLRDMNCTLRKSPAIHESEPGFGHYMIFGFDDLPVASHGGRVFVLDLTQVAEYIFG